MQTTRRRVRATLLMLLVITSCTIYVCLKVKRPAVEAIEDKHYQNDAFTEYYQNTTEDILTTTPETFYDIKDVLPSYLQAEKKDIRLQKLHINQVRKNVTAFNGTAIAVVLLTYTRSGSSLVGEILQQGESTFYVYEPLATLDDPRKTKPTITYLNGSKFNYGHYDVAKVKYEALKGLLTCNFSLVFLEVFTHKFMSYVIPTRSFYTCLHKYTKGKTGVKKIKYCLFFLTKKCLSTKYRLIKTVRTPMKIMGQLLKQIQNSKVINLIRDPRATVMSQSDEYCPQTKERCAAQLCDKIWEDYKTKKQLQKFYYGRIHTITYEKMITQPIENSKPMYKFMGKELTPPLEQYIAAITTGKLQNCSICSEQWDIKNKRFDQPNPHMDLWKVVMKPKLIDKVELSCTNVLNAYGYQFA